MVTDKPLRPRSCAGPIRAGVRRRDISRHYTSVCGYLLITGPSPRWPANRTTTLNTVRHLLATWTVMSCCIPGQAWAWAWGERLSYQPAAPPRAALLAPIANRCVCPGPDTQGAQRPRLVLLPWVPTHVPTVSRLRPPPPGATPPVGPPTPTTLHLKG